MELEDFVVRADQLLTMPDSPEALDAFDADGDLHARDRQLTGAISDGGVYVEGDTIEWVGPWNERPDAADPDALPVIEADVATPGWIDCHTHAVFAGDRSDEFVARNAGRSYQAILEEGGGILETVEAVRQTGRQRLVELLRNRVYESVRRGVTTLEVKSGYGLSLDEERKLLGAIQEADNHDLPCELVPCFLGAHAVPASHRDRRDDYVDLVCDEMIPSIAQDGLADYCDVFCDEGAFTVDEAERILLSGKSAGLTPRLHADQLADTGAARLAAQVGASSADHLEYTGRDALRAMADADVTAVLLPAVNLFLRSTDHLAPAREALETGGEVALASDFNPGSSMTQDLGLILHLACTLHGLTPGEALRGVTVGAAKALDRDDIGRLEEGARADLTLLDAPNFRYIPYHVGTNHVAAVIQDGRVAYWSNVEDA